MAQDSPLQFKGTTLKIIQTQLRSADPAVLRDALSELTGNVADFFENELTVLDFSTATDLNGPLDWPALRDLFRQSGLQVIATRGLPDELSAAAQAAGLASVHGEALGRPPREKPAPAVNGPGDDIAPPAALTAPPPATPQSTPPPAPPPRTITLDKPLRSGQRFYAKGCDLVVTAMVSAGAEVIADGHIHVYAPLRGRALAGASGDRSARIFTTSLEAELVSVAGMYRTFEAGVPAALVRQPATIRLTDPDSPEPRLSVDALALR
ncbi:MAG: septum site-determining protein MinC [Dechloromonas sp.]|nr:septum site-determining protein MinC [Dechloromonas sp.]